MNDVEKENKDIKCCNNTLFIGYAAHIWNIYVICLLYGDSNFYLKFNSFIIWTFLPLIKHKLDDHDHCSSRNYRSIAIRSLFLDIVDWVVMLLFGFNLQLEDLQFCYPSIWMLF